MITVNEINTENATNNIVGFEIIIKTPNNVIDNLFSRIDKLIEILDKK